MITCVAGLSACSSNDQKHNLIQSLLNRPNEIEADPTFIAYEEAGAPAYLVSIEARDRAYTLFAHQTTNAKDEETWISPERLSLGMKSGMIIATRGLGGDQLAADPSQTLAALQSGQNRITERFITLLNGESHAETLAFRCQVTRQKQAAVDLGPYTADTDLFYEACRNGEIEFRNLFWVERGSRKLVQSRQWISETIGTLALRSIPR
jgi:hypothetical protein